MTRQQAAEKLGVTPQTVSNWLKAGILKDAGVNHITKIDEKTLNRFGPSLKELAATEQKIREAQAESDALCKKEQERLKDIRRTYGVLNLGGDDVLRVKIIKGVLCAAVNGGVICEREYNVLCRLLEKERATAIAEEYGLSRAGIYLIARKGVRKIAEMQDWRELQDEVEKAHEKVATADELISLQRNEIKRLKKELSMYVPSVEEPEADDDKLKEMRSLLKTKIVDMDFSVRTLACLKSYDIETLGDVVTYNKTDLLKIRNFGKKSLAEVEDVLDSLDLSFGMDISKYMLEGTDAKYRSITTEGHDDEE